MIELRNRLYIITDEKLLSRKDFLNKVSEAAAAGAGLIQLREKTSRLRDRAELARKMVSAAHARGVRVVINDDPWLAAAIGADGVHLGQDDAPVEAARALLGPGAVIGVSCYGDIDRAVVMERKGASYVSFGACFPSPTKPKEALTPLSVFRKAKGRISIPLVAIGGIDARNAALVMAAGADMISVVSSVFARKKISRAVSELKLAIGEKDNGWNQK